jgi:hypothetical protein
VKSDVQYVIDSKGNRTGVFMPVEVYEAIMERLEDEDVARASLESKNEPARPFQEVLDEMRLAGEIDV